MLALLGQHGAQRSQWLTGQQLTPDRNGLQAAVSGSPSGETILEQARTLEAELESCRSANERNGRLIRANQSALGSMLHIPRARTILPTCMTIEAERPRASSNDLSAKPDDRRYKDATRW